VAHAAGEVLLSALPLEPVNSRLDSLRIHRSVISYVTCWTEEKRRTEGEEKEMAKFQLKLDGQVREMNASRGALAILGGEDSEVQSSAQGAETTTTELPGGGTRTITRTPDGVTTTTWHDPAAGNGSTRTTTSVDDGQGNTTTTTTTTDQNGNKTTTTTTTSK
jgi:hypothetical protein